MANGLGDVSGNNKGLLSSATSKFDENAYSLAKCKEELGKKSDLINEYSMSKGLVVPGISDGSETKTLKGF